MSKGLPYAYERTGRYLGITDGYFLHDEPHWVSCYCKACWETTVLQLPLVSKLLSPPLQQQLASLQQQHDLLEEQYNNLHQQFNTLQEQHTALQQQYTDVQAVNQVTTAELEEVKGMHNNIQTEEIPKLADLLNNLTDLQKGLLQSHSEFKINTFQANHEAALLNSSIEYAASTLKFLKESVEKVIQYLKQTLEKRKQTKEALIQAFAAGAVPDAVKNAALIPVQAEIDEFQKTIGEWNAIEASVGTITQTPK